MSNWGRWGASDERGTANLVDTDVVARGLGAVRHSRAVSLAAPIVANRGAGVVGRPAPQHFMLRDGGDYAAGLPERAGFGFADDYIALPTHAVTHLDALSHVWQAGQMYNGHPASAVTSRGAARCGIEKAGPIVSRGVLADLVPPDKQWLAPGERISAVQLREAISGAGTELAPGDALLVRTGWLQAWLAGDADASAWPGLDADCADFLADSEIAVAGADNPGVEAFPSGDPACQVPLHVELLRGHGVYFCELMDLSQLAAAGQPTFLFVVAPLNLAGAVGSPVAPVAVM
ncbi:MAG: cyclase family protein [Nocardiopsaceae bacterium]|nr:cyclase family protein [Nocardiopsaceae bacterium]